MFEHGTRKDQFRIVSQHTIRKVVGIAKRVARLSIGVLWWVKFSKAMVQSTPTMVGYQYPNTKQTDHRWICTMAPRPLPVSPEL
jgi:hypothetical protein